MTVHPTALATTLAASLVLALTACSSLDTEPGLWPNGSVPSASPASEPLPPITTRERLRWPPLADWTRTLGGTGYSRVPHVIDDDLWLLDPRAGEIVRVDLATGSEAARIRTGPPSEAAAAVTALAEYDGLVWAARTGRGGIVGIDPATNRVIAEHPLDVVPYALAAGGQTLWAADVTAGLVVSLDPRSGTIRTRERVAAPAGLAVEPRGVWVAERSGTTLARLNPWSGQVVDRVEVGSSPEMVTYAFGTIWTVLGGASGGVVRVDPATLQASRVETEAPGHSVVPSGRELWAVVGPHGCAPGGAALRIDPASLSVTGWLSAACPSWAYRDGSRVLVANGDTGKIATYLLGSRPLAGGPLR